MHRRVVLDRVDAIAIAVVGLEHRDVALRARGMIERLGGGNHRTEIADSLQPPRAALPNHGLAQRDVCLERVVVDQRRWLVEDLVRGPTSDAVRRRHRRLPRQVR